MLAIFSNPLKSHSCIKVTIHVNCGYQLVLLAMDGHNRRELQLENVFPTLSSTTVLITSSEF